MDNLFQGRVRVSVRLRPLLQKEREMGNISTYLAVDKSRKSTAVTFPDGTRKTFTFDSTFDEQSTQTEFYQDSGIRDLIANSVIRGINCTVLAYGQTGIIYLFRKTKPLGVRLSAPPLTTVSPTAHRINPVFNQVLVWLGQVRGKHSQWTTEMPMYVCSHPPGRFSW